MSSKLMADLSYGRGDFAQAVPLYEACIIDLKRAFGDFSADLFSCMEKLATCFFNVKEFDKAIRVHDERFGKMSLFYGEYYSQTLSALFSLAQDYANKCDFDKALSLHEDCFAKRTLSLGAFHELTFRSSCAIHLQKSKKQSSSYRQPNASTNKSASLAATNPFVPGSTPSAFPTDTNTTNVPTFPFAFGFGLQPSTSTLITAISSNTISTNDATIDAASAGTVISESTTSSAALPDVKLVIEAVKKAESPYNKLKTKDLIELIDRRKLSRVGLQEKSELVELLYSSTSVVEKRGVTLKLFQAYRQLALSRNKDTKFWTIARVSAMINGNHEILKADCRFGRVDSDTTLTFADKCPLIDVLLSKHFDSSNKHPLLNLSYREAVGEKANLFVSFAYTDNFIDLVDALELYLETHSKDYPVESTYFWFDTFLNNQWTASDQTFEFWANIFEKTVNEIGHTLCFLSPWENPSILTRVWCLLEMCYSPRISIILSRGEVSSFQKVLCRDSDDISASLCKIKAENATSYVPEDKERIFRVIESMEGGVHAFNVKVMGLIRDWIAASARGVVATSYENSGSSGSSGSSGRGVDSNVGSRGDGGGGISDKHITADELLDMFQAAKIFHDQGRFEEAKKLYERVISGQERKLGPDAIDTLSTINSLALLLRDLGRLEEAEKLFKRALLGKERKLGFDDRSTLNTVSNLATILYRQGRSEEAEKLFKRALLGEERALGPDHASTLATVNNLASFLCDQGRVEEAKKLYERALSGKERTLGPDHTVTLNTVSNLAGLLCKQGRFEEAKKLYERALSGQERALGPYHATTLGIAGNLAAISANQGRFEEAKKLCEKVLLGQERSLGPDHASTLMTVSNLAALLANQGQVGKAKKLYERALSGFTRVLGPNHEYSKMASQNLATLKT